MDNTKDCVMKLTSMKAVWIHFHVVMKNLASNAGIISRV